MQPLGGASAGRRASQNRPQLPHGLQQGLLPGPPRGPLMSPAIGPYALSCPGISNTGLSYPGVPYSGPPSFGPPYSRPVHAGPLNTAPSNAGAFATGSYTGRIHQGIQSTLQTVPPSFRAGPYNSFGRFPHPGGPPRHPPAHGHASASATQTFNPGAAPARPNGAWNNGQQGERSAPTRGGSNNFPPTSAPSSGFAAACAIAAVHAARGIPQVHTNTPIHTHTPVHTHTHRDAAPFAASQSATNPRTFHAQTGTRVTGGMGTAHTSGGNTTAGANVGVKGNAGGSASGTSGGIFLALAAAKAQTRHQANANADDQGAKTQAHTNTHTQANASFQAQPPTTHGGSNVNGSERQAAWQKFAFRCKPCAFNFRTSAELEAHEAEIHVFCDELTCSWHGPEPLLHAHKVSHLTDEGGNTIDAKDTSQIELWLEARRRARDKRRAAKTASESPNSTEAIADAKKASEMPVSSLEKYLRSQVLSNRDRKTERVASALVPELQALVSQFTQQSKQRFVPPTTSAFPSAAASGDGTSGSGGRGEGNGKEQARGGKEGERNKGGAESSPGEGRGGGRKRYRLWEDFPICMALLKTRQCKFGPELCRNSHDLEGYQEWRLARLKTNFQVKQSRKQRRAWKHALYHSDVVVAEDFLVRAIRTLYSSNFSLQNIGETSA